MFLKVFLSDTDGICLKRRRGSCTPKFLLIILIGTATSGLSVKQKDQNFQTPLHSRGSGVSSSLVLLGQGVQGRPANSESLQAVCVHTRV